MPPVGKLTQSPEIPPQAPSWTAEQADSPPSGHGVDSESGLRRQAGTVGLHSPESLTQRQVQGRDPGTANLWPPREQMGARGCIPGLPAARIAASRAVERAFLVAGRPKRQRGGPVCPPRGRRRELRRRQVRRRALRPRGRRRRAGRAAGDASSGGARSGGASSGHAAGGARSGGDGPAAPVRRPGSLREMPEPSRVRVPGRPPADMPRAPLPRHGTRRAPALTWPCARPGGPAGIGRRSRARRS